MSHSFCSDGHFSATIGRLQYWSALGSFFWSVRQSPVTPCPPQLLQLVQNSSSVWQWSRTCVVVCCWFQSCGMHCCELWPRAVSRAVFVSSWNDRLHRAVHIHQVVSDWQNWCINLSYVNSCFQRGWWGRLLFHCSAEFRNGMTSVKDAEYSGCLPTSRMYRNVDHIYGM